MARPKNPLTRSAAAFNLLLHLVLVGVGAVLDARLELHAHAAERAPSHVEDASDASCHGPTHTDRLCLVRALHSMDVPLQPAVEAAPPLSASSTAYFLSAEAPRSFTRNSPLGPRAPPTA